MKRRLATCGLALAFHLPVVAQADQSPSLAAAQTFIERTYQAYCDDCEGPKLESPRLLSSRLLALVRKDRRLTPEGYVGALDWDPICNCQDWEIREVKVEVRRAGADRAVAVARFLNGGNRSVVRLDLLAGKAGWRIDNIRTAKIPDLAEHLRRHAGGR